MNAEAKYRLRILWVKIGGLWPLNTGGRLRSFHILSELSQRHAVTLVTTHKSNEDPGALVEHLAHCTHVASFAHDAPRWNSLRFACTLARSWLSEMPVDLYKARVPDLTREVNSLLDSGQFDLCIVDFLFAAPNISFKGQVPIVFFSHNVEHLIWKRLWENDKFALRRALLGVEWRKMCRYEASVCRKADLTIAVSREDQRLFHRLVPECNATSISTGVDVDYFRSGAENVVRPHLVFSGSMDWYPNEDAMLYFMESILPLIRREIPELALTIVGRNPRERLKNRARRANVEVTGTVDDVRPYLDAAAVYIVPLRIGGGTRLKIFEALAMGKAVVSTSIGAEGLPLKDGEHFLCADEPVAFAHRVISLLREPRRARALGYAGRKLVEARYSWDAVTDEFETLCRRHARVG